MVIRTSDKTARNNERDFPHVVELRLPWNGFGPKVDAMDAFHRERGIDVRRGRNIARVAESACRWCFADAATAKAFQLKFGGTVITVSKPC